MTLDDLIRSTRAAADNPDPLELVTSAAIRQRELTQLSDQLVDHFVQEARSAGCSWAAIGRALGVTKQAAQQRYAGEHGLMAKLAGAATKKLTASFARFSKDARSAVVAAEEEARQLAHDRVGPEHLLIGVAAQVESTGSKALTDCGVDADRLRAAVEAIHGRGVRRPSGHIRFTPQAKKLLELSLRQALRLEHRNIGTEHIVLGVLTARNGPALRILAHCDVDPDALRGAVDDRLESQA